MSMTVVSGKAAVEVCNLDGEGWVVVDESLAQASGSPTSRRTDAEELELKKRVWKFRVVQRKSPAKVVSLLGDDEDDVDEAVVEAYAAEIEKLRSSLGTHYTWFEEELQAGRYDAVLLGNEPAAAADDGQAFPGLEAGKPKCSLTSRFAPTFRTKAVLTEKAVKKVQMPAQELWMAAKERRKSNFFGAAVIGVKGGAHALFSILVFADVGEAVNLGQVSRGFSEEVLYSVSLEDLWRDLGARYLAAVAPAEAVAAPPFAGDPAFSVVTWACRRSFVRRLATNAAKPMVVVEELPELTSGSAELGPFLCGDGTGSSSSAMPDRLLVCDGRQLFHVVDVARRREEEVAVDRFASRALRSSLGAHPTSVTASWPTRRGRRCQAGGGVLATRPAVRKGAHAREAADAFQWLELPRFLLEEANPAAQEAAAADARQQAAPKNKKTPTCSPELGPAGKQAGKKPSPTCSPELAPKQPHGKKAPAVAAATSLFRHSVPKDRVVTALRSHTEREGPSSSLKAPEGREELVVEAAWALPGARVLLLVRDAPRESAAAAGTPFRSPAQRPAASPKMPVLRSPVRGLESSPTGPKLARQLSPGGCFELPFSAVDDEDEDLSEFPPGCRVWLQAWRFPDADGASPEPLASASLTSPVTAVDFVSSPGADDGGEELLVLCGLGCGGAELWALAGGGLRRARSWAGGAEGAVRHVLLRPCAAAGAGGTAVVAQEGLLRVCGADAKEAGARQVVLPAKGYPDAVDIFALRPLGTRGFAACTDQHVYAFEVRADGVAELAAVVTLPVRAQVGQSLRSVRHFEVTPYEFFAVLHQSAAERPDRNAVCSLWPWAGDSEASLRIGAPGSGHVSRTKCSEPLKAWTRDRGAPELKETKTMAVWLNSSLLRSHECPAVGTLALHNPPPAAGRRCGGGAGAGLLALAALGPGISVFRWGVEASAEIQRWREKKLSDAASEERQHALERKRFQLQRLRQRLQETEKLEERLKEKGPEALTEEEQAKLQRKPQVQIDIDRLTFEIGEEDEQGQEPSEPSDAENAYLAGGRGDEEKKNKRRLEKEQEKKSQAQNKRCLQKERQKNRDTKFMD